MNFCHSALSQQQFLSEYWQKKPLLIRQAFPDFESPVSPDELAGLACEEEIESRLIEENSGQWRVTCGPLTEDDFSRLPETHWTMLVQDVDKHCPDLQDLLMPFDFIPDWRRDDLMVSYAPKFGSVGPHTDSYDVFLLQALGTRQWQIMDEPIHEAVLIDGIELQILSEFKADQTWELKAGDMLYLPPHIAHHGVALDDCMTFSFGFRAPKKIEVLDAVVNTLLEKGKGQGLYTDPDLVLATHKAEIDRQSVEHLKQLLHEMIEEATPVLAQSLGQLVTQTKPSLEGLAQGYQTDKSSIVEISQLFAQGEQLQRNPYYRFAWSKTETGGVLFMAGEPYVVDREGEVYLPLLAENHTLTEQDWQKIVNNSTVSQVLIELLAFGGWFWTLDAV